MSQFEKVSQKEATTYGIPYDYKSVMHYTETAFARKGRISMETKDPQYQVGGGDCFFQLGPFRK